MERSKKQKKFSEKFSKRFKASVRNIQWHIVGISIIIAMTIWFHVKQENRAAKAGASTTQSSRGANLP